MKNLFVVALLVLCLGFVSAGEIYYKEKFVDTKYFVEDFRVISRTVLVDYDNEDRHSTYDYRHGYSYRATREYFEDRDYDFSYGDRFEEESIWGYRDRDDWGRVDWEDGYYWGRDKGWIDLGVKGYYYEYVPHLRSYEKRECYLSAPSDKLFYVKC